MTSHEQRGGFVMLYSAAFPVAYVTSMAPLRFFVNAGAFCAMNDMSENLYNNEKQVITNWEKEVDKVEDSEIPLPPECTGMPDRDRQEVASQR